MTPSALQVALDQAEGLRRDGRLEEAVEVALAAAAGLEVPPPALSLFLARTLSRLDRGEEAGLWAVRAIDAADDLPTWQAAGTVLARTGGAGLPPARRRARLGLVGSATTSVFTPLLELAAARAGVRLDVYEGGFGQYRQEVLDPGSGLHAFAPELVVLAVHEGEMRLPHHSADPAADVEAEVRRWTGLWDVLRRRSGARIVQMGFALAPERPLGHLGARVPGARATMAAAVNARLAEAAGDDVAFVDCDHLASLVGKHQWFDPRFWHQSKQPVSLAALPLLARHTAAVVAASLGLSKKCLVLDLDNTLWGGVIGEEGLEGIGLGPGSVAGEAYVSFQEHLLALQRRGVMLAVVSKNEDADARAPFEHHPEMRIRLADLTMLIASWEPKPEQVRRIASTLNIGLDSMVFVDDNPVEREAMRQLCPEVDVVVLPPEPSLYVRALSDYLPLEPGSLTADDLRRTEQYRARAEVKAVEERADSLEDFLRSLEMRSSVQPFTEVDLPRVEQLLGKTNQFNLTTRRHGLARLRAFVDDPRCIHLAFRLRDRFTDHGLVGVAIAVGGDDGVLDIDTWLMSCRVIGRTFEQEMLHHLSAGATARGHATIRGTYLASAKNLQVSDVYGRLGFERVDAGEGWSTWTYDVSRSGVIPSPFITSDTPAEEVDA